MKLDHFGFGRGRLVQYGLGLFLSNPVAIPKIGPQENHQDSAHPKNHKVKEFRHLPAPCEFSLSFLNIQYKLCKNGAQTPNRSKEI